jgi:hypothetical protein
VIKMYMDTSIPPDTPSSVIDLHTLDAHQVNRQIDRMLPRMARDQLLREAQRMRRYILALAVAENHGEGTLL